jgi:hypothetical protein
MRTEVSKKMHKRYFLILKNKRRDEHSYSRLVGKFSPSFHEPFVELTNE